jgi:hypothetical protein
MRITILGGTLVAMTLAFAGTAAAGAPGFTNCGIDDVDKFAGHPKGGPPGVLKQIEVGGASTQPVRNTGLGRAADLAEDRGGTPLFDTIFGDTGGGNGQDGDCGDPGNAGNQPGSGNDVDVPDAP